MAAREKDCRKGSDRRRGDGWTPGAEEDEADEAGVLVEDPCGIKEKCQGRQEEERCEEGPVRAHAVVDDGVERDVQLQGGPAQVINAEQGGEQETGSGGQGSIRGVIRDERVRQETASKRIEARQGDENLAAWPCRPNFSGSLYVAGWDGGEGWRQEG